jgi:hypothetical protein
MVIDITNIFKIYFEMIYKIFMTKKLINFPIIYLDMELKSNKFHKIWFKIFLKTAKSKYT